MCAGKISRVFRFHHSVASRPTERDRLGVFESAITAERAGAHEEERDEEKCKECVTGSRIVEIEFRVSFNLFRRAPATASPLEHHPDRYNQQPKNQNRGKDDVSKNPQIRILAVRSNLDQKQQDDAGEGSDDNSTSNKTDVIAQ